jgi:hypothetical protein
MQLRSQRFPRFTHPSGKKKLYIPDSRFLTVSDVSSKALRVPSSLIPWPKAAGTRSQIFPFSAALALS